MKVLSISSIIFSFMGIMLSFRVMNMGCTSDYGFIAGGKEPGILMLIVSGFFMFFSIVMVIKSFSKKQ